MIDFEKIENIKGWFRTPKKFWTLLKEISSIQKEGNLIEIGTYHGRRFAVFADLLTDNEVGISIDIWGKYDENLSHDYSGYTQSQDLEHFKKNIKEIHPEKDIRILHQDSRNTDTEENIKKILSKSKTERVRIFSIDGGHTYDCTLNDLNIAKSLTSEDGVIIIDDYYNMDWPGVKTAVDNWLMQNKDYLCFFATSSGNMICKKSFHEKIKNYIQIHKKKSYDVLYCRESNRNINNAVTAGLWDNTLDAVSTIGIFSLFGRCGSTSLSELFYNNIQDSGQLLTEPLSRFYDNWGSLPAEKNPPKITIDNIQDVIKQYKVKIIKTIEHDLNEKNNTRLLNIFSKKIFLYRKCFVDYFASRWMSHNFRQKTKKSLYYFSHIKEDPEFHSLVRDPLPIEEMIIEYAKYKNKMKFYLSQVKFDCVIDYESLYGGTHQERKNTFLNLCKWIDVPLKKELNLWSLDIDRKHNSYDNYQELIPNWEQVLQFKKYLTLSKDNRTC